MPTFDFRCTKCGETFEKTLSFGVKTKPACPQCASKKTEKLLSMPGIVFKGTGFYKNDNKPAPVTKKKEEKPAEPEKKPEAPKKAETTKKD